MSRYPTKPATAKDVRWGVAKHADCGGAVRCLDDYGIVYICPKCLKRWTGAHLRALPESEIAARFYVEIYPDGGAPQVLVWVDAGKTRYSKLLPLHEAVGLERVKVGW